MIQRVQMNTISFKMLKVPKDEFENSPAIKIIRDSKEPPTCNEMYEELDRLKEEIETADKKLARIWKSSDPTNEQKTLQRIGRMRTHQLLLEEAIRQRFGDEFQKYEAQKAREKKRKKNRV